LVLGAIGFIVFFLIRRSCSRCCWPAVTVERWPVLIGLVAGAGLPLWSSRTQLDAWHDRVRRHADPFTGVVWSPLARRGTVAYAVLGSQR
jgi:hypothetical protein